MADFKKQGSQSCNCGAMGDHSHCMKNTCHEKGESKGDKMGSERQERNESKNRKEVK